MTKKDNNRIGEDVEKLESSYIADGNVKHCSRFGKSLTGQKVNKHRVNI